MPVVVAAVVGVAHDVVAVGVVVGVGIAVVDVADGVVAVVVVVGLLVPF